MRVVVAADFGGSLTKVALALVASESTSGGTCEGAAGGVVRLPSKFRSFHQDRLDIHLTRGSGEASVDLVFFAFQNSEPEVMLDFFAALMILRERGIDISSELYCTGGAVSKHRQSLEACGFSSLVQTDEIQSLRSGMEVLATCASEGEFYTVEDRPGAMLSRKSTSLPSSFILMQVGSGTNVMAFRRAARPPQPSAPTQTESQGTAAGGVSFDVQRVDGSALGGASCYGLSLLLAGGGISYADCLREIATGDSNGVDMVVGDIYGQDGYECAGLDPTVLAASAGRVVLNPQLNYRREDALASIFNICCLNIAHIGSLNGRLHSCEGIVFTGGFFQASDVLQQKIRGAVAYYTSGKVDPVFVGHDAVLGCLGALARGGLEPRGHLDPFPGGAGTPLLSWD